MKYAGLVLGGLLILIGLYLMSAVVTAREIRDAETNNFIYGGIIALVGLVVAFVARIVMSQRE